MHKNYANTPQFVLYVHRLFLSCSYPCTDVTILHKNPNIALIYVNTTLFAPLHYCMFQGAILRENW